MQNISKTTLIRVDSTYPKAIVSQSITASFDEYRKVLRDITISDYELNEVVNGLSGIVDFFLDDYFMVEKGVK